MVRALAGYGLCFAVVNARRAASAAGRPRLLVLGDSLGAGYGLPRDKGFVARLQAALDAKGRNVEVVDGSVSGDTTAGGLARLDWLVSGDPPRFAIVELGGNDGLRGIDPKIVYANLDRILGALTARGIRPLLAGMLAPRNLGSEYAAEFDAVFGRAAARHGAPLYPFFLDGVAAEPSLNQPDGIHPNALGVERIVERILPAVEKLIAGG